MFMGNTYFYGKIVSMFGDNLFGKGAKGTSQIMKYMVMSEMFKGNSGLTAGSNNGMSSMFPMLMMMNGGSGFD